MLSCDRWLVLIIFAAINAWTIPKRDSSDDWFAVCCLFIDIFLIFFDFGGSMAGWRGMNEAFARINGDGTALWV